MTLSVQPPWFPWMLDRDSSLTAQPRIATQHQVSDLIRLSPSGAGRHGVSQVAGGMGCERKFALRHIVGVASKYQAEYLTLGTLIHTGLAYRAAATMPAAERPSWYSIPLEQAWLTDASNRPDLIAQASLVMDAVELDKAREPNYRARYVEHEFQASVRQIDPDGAREPIDDIVITAKVDLAVEDHDGIWLVDHKTKQPRWNSAQLPEFRRSEYEMSPQAHLYTRIARVQLGQTRVRGFIIHRLHRAIPFDQDWNALHLPPVAYGWVGSLVRRAVREQVVLRARVERGETPEPTGMIKGLCGGAFPCDYYEFCTASPSMAVSIFEDSYRSIPPSVLERMLDDAA